jgi:hypothetical protein
VQQTSERSLRRLVGEGIAIVLSILLAFAIDAWWEEQAERTEEKEILKSLVAEFEANRAEAELIIAIHRRQIQSMAILVSLTDEQILSMSSEEIAKLITSMANPWGFDAVRGTTDALIGSGKLGILQDRRLREALTTFVGMDEEALLDRNILIQRSHMVWDELVRTGGPWRTSRDGRTGRECENQVGIEICEMADAMGYLPEATPQDLLRVSQNRILMGYANQNKAAAAIYLQTVLQTQSQIESILGLLEGNL